MVENNQEYRSTGPLARPFARTAHSLVCSGLLASLAPSAALTRSLAHSLHSLPRSWEKRMISWLFCRCFFLFSTIVHHLLSLSSIAVVGGGWSAPTGLHRLPLSVPWLAEVFTELLRILLASTDPTGWPEWPLIKVHLGERESGPIVSLICSFCHSGDFEENLQTRWYCTLYAHKMIK